MLSGTAKESNLEVKKKEAGGGYHVTSGALVKFSILLTSKANSTQGSESESQRKEHGVERVVGKEKDEERIDGPPLWERS